MFLKDASDIVAGSEVDLHNYCMTVEARFSIRLCMAALDALTSFLFSLWSSLLLACLLLPHFFFLPTRLSNSTIGYSTLWLILFMEDDGVFWTANKLACYKNWNSSKCLNIFFFYT